MPQALRASALACVGGPWSAVDADLLVIPWFENESPSSVPGLDAATGGEVARALASREFQGKAFDLFLTGVADRSWKARRIALIGAGHRSESGGEMIRKLAAAGGLGARQQIGRAACRERGER